MPIDYLSKENFISIAILEFYTFAQRLHTLTIDIPLLQIATYLHRGIYKFANPPSREAPRGIPRAVSPGKPPGRRAGCLPGRGQRAAGARASRDSSRGEASS